MLGSKLHKVLFSKMDTDMTERNHGSLAERAEGQKSYLENPKPPIRVKLDHHDDALKKKMSLYCPNTGIFV